MGFWDSLLLTSASHSHRIQTRIQNASERASAMQHHRHFPSSHASEIYTVHLPPFSFSCFVVYGVSFFSSWNVFYSLLLLSFVCCPCLGFFLTLISLVYTETKSIDAFLSPTDPYLQRFVAMSTVLLLFMHHFLFFSEFAGISKRQQLD